MVTERKPYNPADAKAEKEREISFCLGSIKSKNAESRARAAKRLGELQAGVDELLGALSDPDGIVRAAAADALGHLDVENLHTNIFESLLAALDDRDDRVCSAAIASLGRLGVETAREEILPFLEDHNPYVVNAAIVALARLGPPEIAEKLIGFLESDNQYFQSAAAYAMGVLRYAPAGPIMLEKLQTMLGSGEKIHPAVLGNYLGAFSALQVRESIPLLIELAQSCVGFRSRAVQALIEMNAAEAAPVLAPMLADPGLRIRESLIKLMMTTRYAAGPILIRPLLKDPDSNIRRLALVAAGEMKDLSALKTIRSISLQDSSPYVRVVAVHSLCALLGEEAIPDLLGLAQDTNAYIRRAVANHLGKTPVLTPAGLEALNRLAGDPVAEVQLAAQEALLEHGEILPEAGHNDAVPSQKAALLPEEMRTEVDGLLAALQKWQDGLAKQVRAENADDIAQIDQALSLLIANLEREQA